MDGPDAGERVQATDGPSLGPARAPQRAGGIERIRKAALAAIRVFVAL